MGCYGLTNKAILYEKMTTSHQSGVVPGHYSSLFPIETIEVSFALRDANDPMLLAKTLSNNSFDFGLSAQDFGVIGFLGLISSLLMMFRPCVVLCSVCRKHDYHKEDQAMQRYDMYE